MNVNEANVNTFQFKGEQDTGCRSCGCVFRGESAFNRHRVGEHGVNRTCLVPRAEPLFELDAKGRWCLVR
jgi:uncharacterized C2H2 Zn-finger protein